jgi:hypothetical protein
MDAGSRELLVVGAMGLCVCLGMRWLLVEPTAKSLAADRQELDALQSQVERSRSEQAGAAALDEAMRQVERDRAEIEHSSQLAMDESELYSKIMSLGETLGVHIERSEIARKSRDPRESRAGVPLASAEPSKAGSRVTSLQYQIEVSGSYAGLSAFIQGLQSDLGYTVVKSVELRPLAPGPGQASDHPQVLAIIESEHFAFDASPMQGENFGGPNMPMVGDSSMESGLPMNASSQGLPGRGDHE